MSGSWSWPFAKAEDWPKDYSSSILACADRSEGCSNQGGLGNPKTTRSLEPRNPGHPQVVLATAGEFPPVRIIPRYMLHNGE